MPQGEANRQEGEMATIQRYGLFNHARVEASAFLAVFHNGRLRKSGRGRAVWFAPQGATSLVDIPADERDHQLLVSATTRDFQTVSVQGAATWRAADPLALADRIDFTIDSGSGAYRAEPVAQVEALIDGLIKIRVERFVSARDIGQVLTEGVGPLLASLEEEAKQSPRLAAIGVELAGLRLTALTPSPDLARALRQPTAERLQQAADEATFARRAAAVEKEAAIAENETKAKIKLEEERALLIARERDNDLARAQAAREVAEVTAQGEAGAKQIMALAEAEAFRKLDEARLHGERERAEIAKAMPQVAILADALKQGFGAAKIGTLNLGPDVVSLVGGALARAVAEGAAG
jgi:regulator of protease activity HflC (stomatin/prohibitin superfamily)